MKTLTSPTSPTSIKDLKVTIRKASKITPLEKTERRSMFLSNIDCSLNFITSLVCFFTMNPDFPPERVIEELEKAYRKVLGHYDFLTGRFQTNPNVDRIEIDCNSAGAGFVVASSELTLDDLGDLVNPNPAFKQLAIRNGKAFRSEDPPLVLLQLTTFKCGGFTLGVSLNHMVQDGIGGKIFLENLASLLTNNSIAIPPYNNRQLLAARSPPCVAFSHPELVNLPLQPKEGNSYPSVSQVSSRNLGCRTFRLSAKDMMSLKEKAKIDGEDNWPTNFNVIVAHIWRCKAIAINKKNDPKKLSTVLYAVNIRSRVRPRLPSSYAGNAVLNAYATSTCRELKEGPFSQTVSMVSQAVTRMTDDYIRSVIDWVEINKGFTNGDVYVSSWWKLGLGDVEYPWGKPKWTSPVVHHYRNNFILLLPDAKDEDGDGVNVVVALPPKEMEKFEYLFYNI
ncbi:hypothetical protein GIB67_019391 [Kingdonia uniflora]|uniref:Uncharacterized protein n=1 Tax=Kingdonia uniflora TaxID=39325 RepID=A0A7J7M1P5_9MAGN|nr:hypothetical protein GIB67_019391 [Kingdonia uniflora]